MATNNGNGVVIEQHLKANPRLWFSTADLSQTLNIKPKATSNACGFLVVNDKIEVKEYTTDHPQKHKNNTQRRTGFRYSQLLHLSSHLLRMSVTITEDRKFPTIVRYWVSMNFP